MPIDNNFYGVFKVLRVGTQFIIVENASRTEDLDATPLNLVQGTPKARIMDIGGMREDFSVSAPVLIGGGSAIDGRTLLLNRLQNAMDPRNAELPVLVSADIEIDAKSYVRASMQLKSDGNPANSNVFELFDDIPTGTLYGEVIPSVLLDPIGQVPTRTARFYDIRVSLGGIFMYVMKGNIKVEVGVKEEYFLGGHPADGAPDDDAVDLVNNWGTHYPWMGVDSVKIVGSGKAAVKMEDLNADYDFRDYTQDYPFEPGSEKINLGMGTSNDTTTQLPGQVVYVPNDFKIQIRNDITDEWEDIFYDSITDETLVDLSRAIVHKSTFNITTGMLTVDFDFLCWVK